MVTSLITLVVWIVVIGLVLFLLNYLIDNIPLQDPFKRVAKTVLLVGGVLIMILLLLQFAGLIDNGPPRLLR